MSLRGWSGPQELFHIGLQLFHLRILRLTLPQTLGERQSITRPARVLKVDRQRVHEIGGLRFQLVRNLKRPPSFLAPTLEVTQESQTGLQSGICRDEGSVAFEQA